MELSQTFERLMKSDSVLLSLVGQTVSTLVNDADTLNASLQHIPISFSVIFKISVVEVIEIALVYLAGSPPWDAPGLSNKR